VGAKEGGKNKGGSVNSTAGAEGKVGRRRCTGAVEPRCPGGLVQEPARGCHVSRRHVAGSHAGRGHPAGQGLGRAGGASASGNEALRPQEPTPFLPMAYSWRSRGFQEEFEFQWWCNNTWLCNQNPDGSVTLNTYWKDRCSGTAVYCTVLYCTPALDVS